MAKHRKMTAAQRTVHKTKLKLERETTDATKQRAEALGISNSGEGVKKKFFTYNKLITVKLILLVLFPIVFFIYSPLLLPLSLAYAGTFFIAKSMELEANKGLRKSLWINIPRFDSIFALVLVGIVFFGMILTVSTTLTKPSIFEGKSQSELKQLLISKGLDNASATRAADVISESGMTLSRLEKYSIQVTTMFTGKRVFFESKNAAVIGYGKQITNNNGGGSGGGILKIKGQDGEEPITIDMGEGAGVSSVPIVTIFVQVAVVMNMIIIAGIFAGGLYVVVKMKKQKFV